MTNEYTKTTLPHPSHFAPHVATDQSLQATASSSDSLQTKKKKGGITFMKKNCQYYAEELRYNVTKIKF